MTSPLCGYTSVDGRYHAVRAGVGGTRLFGVRPKAEGLCGIKCDESSIQWDSPAIQDLRCPGCMASLGNQIAALTSTPADWHADLGQQMEELLSQVYECEKWATTEDRIDAAVRLQDHQSRKFERETTS